MTKPLARPHLPFALLLLASCENEYVMEPTFPTFENVVCAAESVSVYTPPGGQDRNAGTSVDIASSGDAWDSDLYRWVVSGAPGDSAGNSVGRVRATIASTTTGAVDATSALNTGLNVPISFLGVGALPNFGQAVFAADVRDCYPSGFNSNGCGTEIVVGAPDRFTAQSTGEAYWFEPKGDTANGAWAYRGKILPPAGTPLAAEFGFAITAPDAPPDPNAPWLVGENKVPWVAIGAPGDSKVFVYPVAPSAANPFTAAPQVIVVQATFGSRRFGHALVSGDFDGDGIADLAVGMPMRNGADDKGRVWVYRGQSGATPLVATPLQLDGLDLDPAHSFTGDDDEFGTSLAAGRFVDSPFGDALLVGAPAADLNRGGFCQYVLAPDGSPAGLRLDTHMCWANSFNPPAPDEFLGQSVAIGNFQNTDSLDRSETDEALFPEIAVGRPGVNGGEGEVVVFLTNNAGFRWDDPLLPIIEYPGVSAGAGFGTAIRAGHVQETFWEDLVVGAPDHIIGAGQDGTASLTKAVTTSACSDIDNFWESTDVDGDLVTMKLFRNAGTATTDLVWEEDFDFAAIEDFGTSSERVCDRTLSDSSVVPARFEIPAGSKLSLPGAWPCGGGTKTWTGVDLQAFIVAVFGVDPGAGMALGDVTLSLASPTQLDFTLTIDPTLVDLAMLLNGLDDATNCEPLPISGSFINPIGGICE